MFNNLDNLTKEEKVAWLESCLSSTSKGKVALRSRSMRIRKQGEFDTYWALIDEPNPAPLKARRQ